MSAMTPIPTELMRRNETPLRATSSREQMHQHAVRGRSSYPRRRDSQTTAAVSAPVAVC
jgi:hypothetical protein